MVRVDTPDMFTKIFFNKRFNLVSRGQFDLIAHHNNNYSSIFLIDYLFLNTEPEKKIFNFILTKLFLSSLFLYRKI